MLRARPYAADRHTPVGLLQTFLDEELDVATARVVRQHLERCGDCRDDAEVFRAITASIHRLGLAVDPLALSRLRVLVSQLTAAGS